MSERFFPKRERQCAQTEISRLFRDGQNLRHGALTLKWILKSAHDNEGQVKVLISVPKRRVPKAVDRNRIKRRLRELYRLNKSSIPAVPENVLHMAVIYGGKPQTTYLDLEKSYLRIMKSLRDILSDAADNEMLNKN